MYNVYHGSWRDFTTAVGVFFFCTEMNTVFGATFVGHWFVEAFCSLRSHGHGKDGVCIIFNVCDEWRN